jgi:hypothetical protein
MTVSSTANSSRRAVVKPRFVITLDKYNYWAKLGYENPFDEYSA